MSATEKTSTPKERIQWMDSLRTVMIPIPIPILFFLFNIVGLPTYPSAYDKFLIAVSLGINALTVWTAWGWV